MFKVFNEDCFVTMNNFIEQNTKVDLILTSPPYNMTKRKGGVGDSGRYDMYIDWKSENEYCEWTSNLFKKFNLILNENGVVLYNFSYSIENPSLPYKIVTKIESETNFKLVDTIIWKKKNGLPFPANKYRLSRIFEFVFVFVHSDNMNNYSNNRKVKSVSEKTKQKYYDIKYNFIEAKNNDGKCSLNQATYSSDLCLQLLDIYCDKNIKPIIYDPFLGTGTTIIASLMYDNGDNVISCFGSEISKKQCEFTLNRIKLNFDTNLKMFL